MKMLFFLRSLESTENMLEDLFVPDFPISLRLESSFADRILEL